MNTKNFSFSQPLRGGADATPTNDGNTTRPTALNVLPVPLAEYAMELINNGFTILLSGYDNPTWIHYAKNDKIGYVQFEKYRGFGFSTVHKPNSTWGTGISMYREVWEPTLEMAEKTAITTIPGGFNNYGGTKGQPVKYSGVEEFVKKSYSPILAVINA